MPSVSVTYPLGIDREFQGKNLLFSKGGKSGGIFLDNKKIPRQKTPLCYDHGLLSQNYSFSFFSLNCSYIHWNLKKTFFLFLPYNCKAENIIHIKEIKSLVWKLSPNVDFMLDTRPPFGDIFQVFLPDWRSGNKCSLKKVNASKGSSQSTFNWVDPLKMI